MELETVNKLYLELSQIATAKTARELELEELLREHFNMKSEVATALDRMAVQKPVVEHALKDIRCECCGYMTYHREHMGCIRRATATRVDCNTCANRGKVDGLSQETHCEHCQWQEQWRTDHYVRATETTEKEQP